VPALSWKVETNAWNRMRYTLWAPVYDIVGRRFDGRRRESLRLLDPRPGERVLIVGAGTGADLPYLAQGCIVVATDLTPAMLARARAHVREGIHLALMDGQSLGVRSVSCDAVVLHLILAVIPDPARCLQEAARVLRPGGRLVVFDKFIQARRPPVGLRLLNVVTRTLFTDVTRRFQDILERSGAPLLIERDSPALFGGLFRHLLLRKSDGPPALTRRAAP
jgi:phosphatidylethanolamine/phosphatidyl-N-methylethanolamine N-methyltransferase